MNLKCIFNPIQNERGEINILGLVCTLSMTVVYLVVLYSQANLYRNSRSKLQGALCTKYRLAETENYVKKMDRSNLGIRTAVLMMTNPSSIASAQSTVDGLKAYQIAIHISYLKNTNQSKWCSLKRSAIGTNTGPYGLKIVRNIDQTAKIVRRKWHFYYLNRNSIVMAAVALQSSGQRRLTFQISEASR